MTTETARHIQSLQDLKDVACSGEKPHRVYFGPEFCHRLLPGEEELTEAVKLCRAESIPMTFVTPYLPPEGFKKAQILVDLLCRLCFYPEILIGDYGLLHYINENHPRRFPLILGRLLARQRTGPRIKLIEMKSPGQFESARRCHLDIDSFTGFLKEFGISRIELDWPIQGVNAEMLEKLRESFHLSVHWPWVFVSTTLRCPARQKGRCLCSEGRHMLKSDRMPVELVNMGNSVFYKTAAAFDDLQKGPFDRIVIRE